MTRGLLGARAKFKTRGTTTGRVLRLHALWPDGSRVPSGLNFSRIAPPAGRAAQGPLCPAYVAFTGRGNLNYPLNERWPEGAL